MRTKSYIVLVLQRILIEKHAADTTPPPKKKKKKEMKPDQITINELTLTPNYAITVIDTAASDDTDRVDKSRVTAYAAVDQYNRPWMIFCSEEAGDSPLAKMATKEYLTDSSALNLKEFCAFGRAYAKLIEWHSEPIEITPAHIGDDADYELTERVAGILSDAGFPAVAREITNDHRSRDIPEDFWLAATSWADEEIENTRREEIEYALKILNGDNHRIYPANALSNSEAPGHEEVVDAVCMAMGDGFIGYPTYDDWFYVMDDEEKAKYEDYEDFVEDCQRRNSNIIYESIQILEDKLK